MAESKSVSADKNPPIDKNQRQEHMWNIDDGVDRDKEWDDFMKDEANRKQKQLEKDEDDKKEEADTRQTNVKMNEAKKKRLRFWGPVLFMGPLSPLVGSILAVVFGSFMLMCEHKFNGRPLSVADWFTSSCNYAFIYVVAEVVFSAIFMFVVMFFLIDPGSITIPGGSVFSFSRYLCPTARCIAVWYGMIGVGLFGLNIAAPVMLWETRYCFFTSEDAIQANLNPSIWMTGLILMVSYWLFWPILIFYLAQYFCWKKEVKKKQERLTGVFAKKKIDLSGYKSLKEDMHEEEEKKKAEKAFLKTAEGKAQQKREKKAAAQKKKAEKEKLKAQKKAEKEEAQLLKANKARDKKIAQATAKAEKERQKQEAKAAKANQNLNRGENATESGSAISKNKENSKSSAAEVEKDPAVVKTQEIVTEVPDGKYEDETYYGEEGGYYDESYEENGEYTDADGYYVEGDGYADDAYYEDGHYEEAENGY